MQENYMTQHHYRETKKEDWTRSIMYITLYFAILIFGAIFLLLAHWYFWLILAIGNLFLLIRWHTKNFAYQCPKYEHKFEISVSKSFMSIHGVSKRGGWKYLECPKCHEESRATVIRILEGVG
jgi:hypothetical protein